MDNVIYEHNDIKEELSDKKINFFTSVPAAIPKGKDLRNIVDIIEKYNLNIDITSSEQIYEIRHIATNESIYLPTLIDLLSDLSEILWFFNYKNNNVQLIGNIGEKGNKGFSPLYQVILSREMDYVITIGKTTKIEKIKKIHPFPAETLKNPLFDIIFKSK